MVFEVIRGHPTTKLGVFGVIWGNNSKFFKPGQTIYQNEAFDPVIKKEWFSRSSDPKIRGLWGHLKLKVKDFQTLTPSFGVKIKKSSGPKIASSEARGSEEDTVPPIASSEARRRD